VKDAVVGRTAGEVKEEQINNVYRLEKPDEWYVELAHAEHAEMLVIQLNTVPVTPCDDDIVVLRVHWVKKSAIQNFVRTVWESPGRRQAGGGDCSRPSPVSRYHGIGQ
jgi:hypothetical protein